MYSPAAVRQTPTDRAMIRSLAPQAYFVRRTSRTLRIIGNLSAGIGPPLAITPGRILPGQTAGNGPCITLSTGWPPSVGMGGRFALERAAAFARNQRPPCLGFHTLDRFGAEEAPRKAAHFMVSTHRSLQPLHVLRRKELIRYSGSYSQARSVAGRSAKAPAVGAFL